MELSLSFKGVDCSEYIASWVLKGDIIEFIMSPKAPMEEVNVDLEDFEILVKALDGEGQTVKAAISTGRSTIMFSDAFVERCVLLKTKSDEAVAWRGSVVIGLYQIEKQESDPE